MTAKPKAELVASTLAAFLLSAAVGVSIALVLNKALK